MELIKSEENSILDDHLSLLLNKIAPLATDRENKIRKLANSIFSTIVKQVCLFGNFFHCLKWDLDKKKIWISQYKNCVFKSAILQEQVLVSFGNFR